MSEKTLQSPFDEKYFVFLVTSTWTDELDYNSQPCVLYKKEEILNPKGEDTVLWENEPSTDNLPSLKNIISELKSQSITEVFTTTLSDYPNSKLWGLSNLYAQEDWDYDADPHPTCLIYYSINKDLRSRFELNDISLKDVKIPPEYL